MAVSIFNVADYFINKSYACKMPITHLKLQKLCYYAQAWHLVFHNEQLFSNHFEAWIHGPVNPEVFRKYREYGWEPLDYVEMDSNIFNNRQKKVLDAVWNTYGHLDAKHLEALTHQEKPWKEARKGLPDYQYSNTKISENTMRNYYRSLLEKK